MAEERLLFTLDHEQFESNLGSNILSFLQEEFDTRSYSLSRSLLFCTETGNSYWLLVDFENEKAYNIRKEDDTTVAVSEGPDMEKEPEFLNSTGTILPRLREGISTHRGIIDALKRFNFDEFNTEKLIRSDLSRRQLSFQSVYPDLQDVDNILKKILSSSRESLIGLSYNDVEQIKSHVIQFYDLSIDIGNFEVESENIRDDHAELLQRISNFRETVIQSLLLSATYLSTTTVEQLENQVKSTLTDAEEKFNTKISEEVDKLQTTGAEINEQHTEVIQSAEEKLKEIEQTHIEYQNQLTEKPISQYKEIFAEQAEKHKSGACFWMGMAVVATTVFFLAFILLSLFLKSEGTQIAGILQNLFTKGFILSPIYVWLNRSIKNHTAQKHLEVINIHRQNALETFDTFVSAAEGNRDTRDQVLLAATRAIFEANQSGYLSTKTSGSDSASPVQQIIKEVIPSKSSTDSE